MAGEITREGAVAAVCTILTVGTILLILSTVPDSGDRAPEPPTGIQEATQGPVVAYPRCGPLVPPHDPCVTIGEDGRAFLAFGDGNAIPAIVDRTEMRDGEMWVIIR